MYYHGPRATCPSASCAKGAVTGGLGARPRSVWVTQQFAQQFVQSGQSQLSISPHRSPAQRRSRDCLGSSHGGRSGHGGRAATAAPNHLISQQCAAGPRGRSSIRRSDLCVQHHRSARRRVEAAQRLQQRSRDESPQHHRTRRQGCRRRRRHSRRRKLALLQRAGLRISMSKARACSCTIGTAMHSASRERRKRGAAVATRRCLCGAMEDGWQDHVYTITRINNRLPVGWVVCHRGGESQSPNEKLGPRSR